MTRKMINQRLVLSFFLLFLFYFFSQVDQHLSPRDEEAMELAHGRSKKAKVDGSSFSPRQGRGRKGKENVNTKPLKKCLSMMLLKLLYELS